MSAPDRPAWLSQVIAGLLAAQRAGHEHLTRPEAELIDALMLAVRYRAGDIEPISPDADLMGLSVPQVIRSILRRSTDALWVAVTEQEVRER